MQHVYNLCYDATDAQKGGLDDLKPVTLHWWDTDDKSLPVGAWQTTTHKSAKGSPCQSFTVLSHPFLCKIRTLLKS